MGDIRPILQNEIPHTASRSRIPRRGKKRGNCRKHRLWIGDLILQDNVPGLPEKRCLLRHDGILTAGLAIRVVDLKNSEWNHPQLPVRPWRPGRARGRLRIGLSDVSYLTGRPRS